MKKYNIFGSFTIDVDFDIEAKSEPDAKRIAKKMIIDQYNFDAIGGLHIVNTTAFNLDADVEDE